MSKAASRLRLIQVGASAGAAVSLPAASLRSSGLELLGSGFGSASLDQIRGTIGDLFTSAKSSPFVFKITPALLRDVEALWNSRENGTRLVFQP